MIELDAIRVRSVRAPDIKTVMRLLQNGRQYATMHPHNRGNAIVAEVPTLTPVIVGYLAWNYARTSGRLLPNHIIATLAVDPFLGPVDADAIAIAMLRRMYEGFSEVRRGYIKITVPLESDAWRNVLESERWEPLPLTDGTGYISYAWYARRYFEKGPPDE